VSHLKKTDLWQWNVVTDCMMAAADDKYVCKLDAKSLERAKKELHEDPKERLSAVAALRTWIQQQPHLTVECSQSTIIIS